jgi:LytS/YehU family sensor histidine kinase
MTHKNRAWFGALLSGSAIALAYLNLAAYLHLPGKPALWVAAAGAIAGLAGALWMRGLEKPSLPQPAPGQVRIEQGVPWQINRLFVFNTLHNAAALTVADPDKARSVIEKFAEFIRVVHELNQSPTTLLNLELRAAAMFLAIERARFGERLQVREEVAPEHLEAVVPSLALQPLVAYAIRSGVELTADPVQVMLQVRSEDRALILEVHHDGPGEMDPVRQDRLMSDLGFTELKRLLRERSGEGALLEMARIDPRGECVRIRLAQDGRGSA